MLALMMCLLADPEPAAAVKVLARGPFCHPKFGTESGKIKGVVLRSAADAVSNTNHAFRSVGPDITEPDATRDVAASLKVKNVDWSRHTVIAVLAGQRGSNAYKVEITGFRLTKGTLVVSWKLHKDPKGGDDVITFPSQCVLIPRHAGKVEFDPPMEK